MNCPICKRVDLNERELEVHIKYFHNSDQQKHMAGVCPECKDTLWSEGGCLICHSCGFSKCG